MQSNQSNQVKKHLRFTAAAAALGAALMSIPAVFLASHSAALNHLGIEWVAIVCGIIGSAIWVAIIEWGF